MATTPHSDRAHAKLSPSAGARWTTCTAYPAAKQAHILDLPADNGSSYSREGTLAHEVCDALLLGKEIPQFLEYDFRSGPTISKKRIETTQEMIAHGKEYAAFIQSLMNGVLGSTKLSIEMEVPLWYSPGENGHVDCFIAIQKPDGTFEFHVVDYKYGAGVSVDAQDNTQMIIYAAAAIYSQYDFASADSPVNLHIFQPRTREAQVAGPVSSWTVTLDRLRHITARDIDTAVQIIEDEDCAHLRKFAPSDKACQFCELRKAKLCDAYRDKMLADEGFEEIRQLDAGVVDVILPTPESLAEVPNREQILVNVFKAAPRIRKWLDGIEEHLEAMANSGRPIPGTKMVEGKGSRGFTDEAAAAKLLLNHLPRDVVYVEKLISVAKAETALKPLKDKLSTKFTNKLASLIVRKPGSPVLALAEDKRPAVKGVDEEFTEVLPEPDFASMLE